MSRRARQYARFLSTQEKIYYRKVLSALKSHYSSFTSDIKLHGLSHALNNLNRTPMNNRVEPILRQIYKNVGQTAARSQFTELTASVRKGSKAGGFGRNEFWIREVTRYLEMHKLKFVQDISDTTRSDIQRIINKAVNEQWPLQQIVKELQTTKIVEARAAVIVRTELVRASNVGHAVGAQSFPYEVNKVWISANDHRTRHGHRMVHKHVTAEDGIFTVPVVIKKVLRYEKMKFPGDPDASAANTCNCRCRVVYEPKRDANGNLIERSQPSAHISPLYLPVDQSTPLPIRAQV